MIYIAPLYPPDPLQPLEMKEAEITEQFRLLQQEVVLAGEAIETLKRNPGRWTQFLF